MAADRHEYLMNSRFLPVPPDFSFHVHFSLAGPENTTNTLKTARLGSSISIGHPR